MAPRPFFVPTVLALLLPLLWLLLIDVRPVFPLNFFFFLVGTNQFERHTFEFLAQEFARRGHKVVTVKPILIPEEPRLVKPVLHMVHEKVLKDVLPERLYRPLERVGADVPWRRGYELEAFQQPYWEAHKFACQRMLNSNLLELLAQEQIELAIVYAGNPCQLGLVHALGLPFVLVDLDGLTDETLVAAGAGWDLPLSAEDGDGDDGIWRPSSLALFSTRVGRLFSLSHELLAQSGMPALASAVSRRYRQLEAPIWAQFQQAGVDRRRGREFPDLGLMKSRAQLILANTDPLLESPGLSLPRRLLPIGGVHIDSPRPLFAPWNQSISSAEQGLILVSLGTQVDTGAMPAQLVRSFLYAFDRLIGHRIFWRLSPGLALPGIEPGEREQLLSGQRMAHLNITAFFPQNELLAHPRTRLLITNGGAHSLMEALHWGVPVLGIPLYGSNMANLEKAKARGLGLWLDKNEARDGQKLLATIKRLLDESSFTRTAKELGRQVRSRPATAFERCLHALESAGRRRPVPIGQPIRPSSSSQLLLRLVLRLHLDLFLALLLAAGTFLALLAWLGRAWLKLANNCVRRCAQWWSNSSHRILAVVYGKVFCTDAEKRPKAE